MYICIFVYVYIYICVCVCMCVCICIYVHIYMCVCVYIYIYISIYCMHQNRSYGTIQHIDPYLYQNRICRLQTAPSENTCTYIQTNSSDTYNTMLPLYLNPLYLATIRIHEAQIISFNNLPTQIHNSLSHLPFSLVSRDVPLPASTHRFTLIPEQNLHVTNCFLSYI